MQRASRRGMQWLAAVADDPVMCRAVWADDPRKPYLLPTGRLFDVVAMRERVGMETFDQLARRRLPLGPVMVDRGAQQMGFFLPPRSREAFVRAVEVETNEPPPFRYLEHGSYVVVPGPMALTGDRHEWLRAPVRRPDSASARVTVLAVVFVAAARLVSRVERYGEERERAVAGPSEDIRQETARAR